VRPADNREVMCSNHIGPIIRFSFMFFSEPLLDQHYVNMVFRQQPLFKNQ
jgi:hypothetical protein